MSKESWKPGNMLYPVPAVMVSCMKPGERPNIITVAWAGTVCSDPAMLSISVRKERFSHSIIEETGEFVVKSAFVDGEKIKADTIYSVRNGEFVEMDVDDRGVLVVKDGKSN